MGIERVHRWNVEHKNWARLEHNFCAEFLEEIRYMHYVPDWIFTYGFILIFSKCIADT